MALLKDKIEFIYYPINLTAIDSLNEMATELQIAQTLSCIGDSSSFISDRLERLKKSKDNYENTWDIPDTIPAITKFYTLKDINNSLKKIKRDELSWCYIEYYDFVKQSLFSEMARIKEYKLNKQKENNSPNLKNKLNSNLLAINALCEIATNIISSPFGESENSFEMRNYRIQYLEKLKTIYLENSLKNDNEDNKQKILNLQTAETLFSKIYPSTVSVSFINYYKFLKESLDAEKKRILNYNSEI